VRSPVADLLADLSRGFAATGIRWYVFGAQAAIVYGVARLTADVDVTVSATDVPTERWVTALEGHGFERRFEDANFIAQTRVVPLVHRATGLPVDIVLAGPGLEQEFLDRAVRHGFDDIEVPVIEVSDLVALKILAARAKDIDDVVALLRIQARTIDQARVRHILRLLEDALGQSDLVPAFEAALRRARE
jgi:hypothetical protein